MQKILIIFFLVLSSSIVKSQDSMPYKNYFEEMDILIKSLNKAQDSETYLRLAKRFEAIALNEESKWVPFYHATYAYIKAYVLHSNSLANEAYLTQAQSLLNTALKLKPANDELTVLQGYIYQAHIKGRTGREAFEWGKKAVMEYDRARFINENNPRPYFLIGDVLYHLKKGFGGNKVSACNHFQQADNKYKRFVPRSEFSPNWGLEENNKMLLKCK